MWFGLRSWSAAQAFALIVGIFASGSLAAADTKSAATTAPVPVNASGRVGGDVDPFANDPLLGGKRLVSDKFQSLPQWDRVRLFMIDRNNLSQAELQALLEWARGLKSTSPRDRLYAVNTRVNK